jgi:hypothetical protein
VSLARPAAPAAEAIADDSLRGELLAKVKGLARRRAVAPQRPAVTLRPRPALRPMPLLLAIGSSTGRPQALFTLVQGLGKRVPIPVVLTQHMPAAFTPILAAHLTRLGAMPCAEARDGQALEPGRIVLAPGNRHLLVQADGGGLRARLGGRGVEIIGTDIAREQLRRAREGVYTLFEVQRGLPMQFLVRYFRKDGANWRLNDAIRAMVSFREWNLLSDLRGLG